MGRRLTAVLRDPMGWVEHHVRLWAVRVAVRRGRRAGLGGGQAWGNPYPATGRRAHLHRAWDRGYRQGEAVVAQRVAARR